MNWKELIDGKDFAELVNESRLKLAQTNSKITNWSVGGVFRTLVEVSCYCVAQLYGLLLKVTPMGFVDYATGVWLELKVAEVGLNRRQAKQVTGYVVFSRINDLDKAVNIKAGSIVKTEMQDNGQELRYLTTADVILVAGQKSVKVPVVAEFAGAAWNVGKGYIRVLVTHISGIDSISNDVDWITSEGVDAESDDSLRQRYKLRWNELATGSTALAYKSWAYQVEGVMDVAVDDLHPRGPGTVDVIITGPAGIPTATLLSEVKKHIDARRPVCSDTNVLAPTAKIIDLNIVIKLYLDRGETAIIKAAAEEIVQDFFVQRPNAIVEAQHIGDDMIKARLNSYLMNIKNVFNVIITSPANDVVCNQKELATRGNVSIIVERATET